MGKNLYSKIICAFLQKQTLTGNRRAPISPTKQPESHYGGPMASKSDNVNFDEFEQAARAIFEVVDELGDKANFVVFQPA